MMNPTQESTILQRVLVDQLTKLFSYEDADINGGDLVEAIGLIVGPKNDPLPSAEDKTRLGFDLLADMVDEAVDYQEVSR